MLGPSIAQAATRTCPPLYTRFSSLPSLRTHVLAWIAKS